MSIAKSDLFLVGGYNLACALKSFTPEASTEEIDATTLCSTFRKYQPGFKSGTLNASGIFDADSVTHDKIHDVFSAAFDDGVPRDLAAGLGFFAIGGDAVMLKAVETKYAIPMPLGQLIMSDVNMRAANGIDFGKWLVSAQRDAGSFNSSSLDNTAASANGGIFQAHLDNNDATGVLVRLQHSTNNATWADLATAIFGTRATGGYTFGVNPSDTDTIEFNGVVFTFITGPSTTTDIQIKGTLALTMVEAAIVLNASVDADVAKAAYTETANGVHVVSIEPGVAGNAYTLDTPTAGNVTRLGATLTGGVDLVADVHDSYSETIAPGTTVRRYLRTVTQVFGGDTNLVSAAFARR